MKFFKHLSESYEPNTFTPAPKENVFREPQKKPEKPKAEEFIGAAGRFKDSLDPDIPWDFAEVLDISRNKFHASNGIDYKFFKPQGSDDVYTVIFGAQICKIKDVVTAQPKCSPDFRGQQSLPPMQDNGPRDGEAVMNVGGTYLFATSPNSRFVKGVFMGKNDNGMVARLDNDVVLVFPFAITEEDYRSGKKDRLICAVDPRKMPAPAPQQQAPNQSTRFDDKKGLVPGNEVMYSDDGSHFDKGIFVGVTNDKFLLQNPQRQSCQMSAEYVIPFDIVEKEGINRGKQFILKVKNGKIFAPNFQR